VLHVIELVLVAIHSLSYQSHTAIAPSIYRHGIHTPIHSDNDTLIQTSAQCRLPFICIFFLPHIYSFMRSRLRAVRHPLAPRCALRCSLISQSSITHALSSCVHSCVDPVIYTIHEHFHTPTQTSNPSDIRTSSNIIKHVLQTDFPNDSEFALPSGISADIHGNLDKPELLDTHIHSHTQQIRHLSTKVVLQISKYISNQLPDYMHPMASLRAADVLPVLCWNGRNTKRLTYYRTHLVGTLGLGATGDK